MNTLVEPCADSRRKPKSAADHGGAFSVELMLFFHAVAETLSFTRAAQQLGIDQSWLSHKIRQFESDIGTKLFLRTTRTVELTSAGRTLLDPARRLAEMAQQAQAATRLVESASGGVLRVGALPFSFQDSQRTTLLDAFISGYPDVQVTISNGTTPQLIEHLRGGRIDLAFVSAPIDVQAFDSLLLRENLYCLLLPEDHPLARVDTVCRGDLAGHRIAIPSKRYSPAAYDLVYRPVVEAGIVPVATPEFECAVSYACGLALPVVCTQHAAERSLTAGWTIRALPFVPRCGKYLIRQKDHRSSAQEAFWSAASQEVGRGFKLH